MHNLTYIGDHKERLEGDVTFFNGEIEEVSDETLDAIKASFDWPKAWALGEKPKKKAKK